MIARSLPLLRRVTPYLFWLFLAAALYLALQPNPPKLYMVDRLGDKSQHMLAFAALTVLANLGFWNLSRWVIAERLSFVGALIEVVQSIPQLHRDCDVRDWIADTAMILIVTLAITAIAGSRAARPAVAGDDPGVPG